MNKLLVIYSISIVIFIGIVSHMSCQDELDFYDQYCDMVIQGTWPNYKNIDCVRLAQLGRNYD